MHRITAVLAIGFGAWLGTTNAQASETSAAAQALIEQLDLRSASQPVKTNPRWAPKKIVVTLFPELEQSMPQLASQLQAAAGEVELVLDRSGNYVPAKDVLAGADALLGICTANTLANADSTLLWLHSYTAGMERCAAADAKLTQDRVFSNNKRLAGPTIAEHSIAMLLAISRGLPAYSRAQQERKWDRELSGNLEYGELNGKTMLVVGLGGIGTEIARLGHALGMTVVATRNSSREGPAFVEYVGLADELPTLAQRADVVVNALPLTAVTTGLFDKAFFSDVKPGAIFISVGRGKSTVTDDLIAALQSGHLYGAGLDVTDPEPLPNDNPLWQMDRVIITPHVSAAGADSRRRMATIAVENLRRYVAGEALLNVVDLTRGY